MSRTAGNTGIIVNDLHTDESRWFAIYTKYKCEKFVVDQLMKKGITAYVPLLSRTKRYTRKTKTYRVPLINCYVFVRITRDQYISVLETEYVMTFIKQRKNLVAIPEEEINLLRRIVGEMNVIDSRPLEFVEGRSVEIIAGNLTGIRGTLVELKGKNEFVVELHNIGYQLRMAIDGSLLRPVVQHTLEA